jgi:adenylosuccinate lyase
MSEFYENPLITRYASREMSRLFSSQKKFSTWRKLWVALAEAEQTLGLPITDAQIKSLKAHIEDIDFDLAAAYEKKLRHDVMAHVHTYGDACPEARGIIHLGATSAYVGDNTDILVMKEALELVQRKIASLLSSLKVFALEYRNMPTLGFTHFQPAQLTTVGKRATLWMQDLLLDYEEVEFALKTLRMRGVKGTTGTQASFLSLFEGDHEKVRALDKLVVAKFGYESSIPVSGQTYSRKLDSRVLNALSQIGQTLHKMTNDLRLLQHLKEVEEPFEKNQIGSSAMAYKRNPMRSERIASLSRLAMANAQNSAMTVSTQWFERTLDDSANRRVSIPEGFLAIDACLDIALNVVSGLVVYPEMIRRHVAAELPFMATENVIMEAVKAGGDRQDLHERIRVHSMEAGKEVKIFGRSNDLIERILTDDYFKLDRDAMESILKPENYVGRAPEQVIEFIENEVDPILEIHKDALCETVDLKV